MAIVHINFVGLWRRLLGVRFVAIEVNTAEEARNYVELNYGPLYWKWLRSKGIQKKQSVWESSNVMLNGRRLTGSEGASLKDGDNLDWIPRVAGG